MLSLMTLALGAQDLLRPAPAVELVINAGGKQKRRFKKGGGTRPSRIDKLHREIAKQELRSFKRACQGRFSW